MRNLSAVHVRYVVAVVVVSITVLYWGARAAVGDVARERRTLIDSRPMTLVGMELGPLSPFGSVTRSPGTRTGSALNQLVFITSDKCPYSRDEVVRWEQLIEAIPRPERLHALVINLSGAETAQTIQKQLSRRGISLDRWDIQDNVGFVAQTGLASTPRTLLLDRDGVITLIGDRLDDDVQRWIINHTEDGSAR